MTDGPSVASPPDWTQDWIEICQSEWRAVAADREAAAAAIAFTALWSEAMAATAALAALFVDGAAGRAWPGPPARPPPAMAPSDAGRAAERRIADLAEWVAELERRLAGLEPAAGPPSGH